MDNQTNLKLLFSGSEIDASILKEILEDNQIASLIRNDMNSGLAASFSGSLSVFAAKVLVAEKDLERAKVLLTEFEKSLKN